MSQGQSHHQSLSVLGASIIGPGIEHLEAFRSIVNNAALYLHAASVLPPSPKLPPTERRRIGLSVKVGLATAEQLFALNPDILASQTASIFTSSGGDGDNCHILCTGLTEEPVMLSPTRFTNSVHNAPAGYYGIAHAAQLPSNSICARDGSFVSGLLEAASYAIAEQQVVALVAYDVPYPEPLNSKRFIAAPFGIGMLLASLSTSPPKAALATMQLGEFSYDAKLPHSRCTQSELETLRQQIPAARGLPLLEALFKTTNPREQALVLDAGDGACLSLCVERATC